MTVVFYADENFPGPVVSALQRLGVNVLSVQEDGSAGSSDEDVLRRAVELSRVLLTQDQDFFEIAVRWQQESRPFPGIFYARHMNLTYRQLIEEIAIAGLVGCPEDFQNSIEVLPLHIS